MTHDKAFALVAKHAPEKAGMLWRTSKHWRCDTAWAVADQYEDDEEYEAIVDLDALANGCIPYGWRRA